METVDDHEDFEFEAEQGDNPFIVHMISGSFAGLMEHVAIYPVDTIKVKKIIKQTHMQSSKKILKFKETAQNLYKNGGILRFWRGVSAIAAGSIPAHSMYFSAYEIAKEKFGVDKKGFQFLSSAITGAIATLFHDLILTPSDGKYKFKYF